MMTDTLIAIKTRDEAAARERARAVVDPLRTLTLDADKARALPEESVALLKDHDLLTVVQSRACGGQAISMRSHVDVISTVAEGCSSAAWVLGVWHAHSWVLGHFCAEARDELFGASPNVPVSAVIAPRGKAIKQADGSYVLNGFWPFGSGNAHVDWLMLGAEIIDDGEAVDEAEFIVPKSAMEILDDWHVAGLQGTGSSSMIACDVTIPAHRVLSLRDLYAGRSPGLMDGDGEWLMQAAAGSVLTICLATGAAGAARAAFNGVIDTLPGKRVLYTHHGLDEWPQMHAQLGSSLSLIEASDLIIRNAADLIDDYAMKGEMLPLFLRARIRMQCAQVVQWCLEAVEALYLKSGAAGLSLKSPLQKAVRDLQATNMHAMLMPDVSSELYGRVLLGKDVSGSRI